MKSFAALLALASTAAAIKGFNYGNTFTTGAAKMQSDFEKEFDTAAHLDGTEGFTSARLYTMIQGGTTSDPISAIPAAIKTKTSLLLGLWTSGDEAGFQNEIKALKAAIAKYGKEFIDLVDGISVGSEDLYRASPMGQAAGSNPGTGPNELVSFIKQTREALKGTGLEGAKIGHVDTWTAWDDGANAAVAEACDWVGMDAYPYFQDTMPNAIGKSSSLFKEALAKTAAGGHGKPVWITETGHPVSGKKSGDSVASIENAEKYWKDVGCPLFDTHNVWWYTLQDASPDTPNPSFGVVGSTLSTKPLFDLSCKDSDKSSSSSSSGSTKTGSGSGAGATGGSHSGSGSGSGSGSHSGSGSGSGSAGSMTNSAGLPIGTGSLGYPSSNGTYTSPSAKPTGTDSGSGSGSGSGSSTGSAGGAASSPPVSGAAGVSGALGAAFLGLIAAVFTL